MILLCEEFNLTLPESERAHPTSASFCVGGTPSNRIIVNNKEVYSNLLLENNFVNTYNLHSYLQNDLILLRSSNYSSVTTDNPSTYDSYICLDEVTHFSDSTTYQKTVAIKSMWEFVELRNERPTYLELPKPILLNTNGGTIIKFYETANSTDSCYEHPCTGKAVSLIYNLIPGKSYYYKVYNASNTVVALGNFTTQGGIRLIRMEGVRNMRDCGGYINKTEDKRLKYGVIFRGSQCLPTYNNDTSGEYNATKQRRKLDGDPSTDIILQGGATLRDVLEFKRLNVGKDIDLRDKSGDYHVVLDETDENDELKINRCVPFFDTTVDNISYWAASTSVSTNPVIPAYCSLFGNDTSNTNTIRIRKSLFVNFLYHVYETVNSGKAVYVHCQLGKDRTGTFLAALFALLGIKDDGVIKDYELTSLWAAGLTTRYNFLYGTGNSGKDKNYKTFNIATNTTPIKSLEEYVKEWLVSDYANLTLELSARDWINSDYDRAINDLKNILLEDV